jgi:hypothetical protein
MRRPHFWLWWSWAARLFQPVASLLFPAPRRRQPVRSTTVCPELRFLEERNPPDSMLVGLVGLGAPQEPPTLVAERKVGYKQMRAGSPQELPPGAPTDPYMHN